MTNININGNRNTKRQKVLNRLDKSLVTSTGRVNLTKLEERYTIDEYPFNEQPQKYITTLTKIKELTKSDRAIILLYTELGSKQAVADLIGVSATAISKEIKRIISIITD